MWHLSMFQRHEGWVSPAVTPLSGEARLAEAAPFPKVNSQEGTDCEGTGYARTPSSWGWYLRPVMASGWQILHLPPPLFFLFGWQEVWRVPKGTYLQGPAYS